MARRKSKRRKSGIMKLNAGLRKWILRRRKHQGMARSRKSRR